MRSADAKPVWQHEGLAVACARRFLGRGVAMEDLLQEARAAVWLAQSRFDPERGVQFSTYAVPVVLGALRECCRRAALMYRPRCAAQAGGTGGSSMDLRLHRSAGRSPAPLHADDVTGEAASSSHQTGSPAQDRPSRQQEVQPPPGLVCHLTADPEVLAMAKEDSFEERLLLRDAIRRLGSPYGQVIGLRYLCGMSQREVGRRLAAPQWQVCRWEKAGLEKLRMDAPIQTIGR